MSDLKVKVCGLKYMGNILDIASLKPDYIGFIMYPLSSRYSGDQIDINHISKLPDSIKKVGVFVKMSVTAVAKYMKTYGLDVAQLHGDESPDDVRILSKNGYQVIKVFRVDSKFDFSITETFEHADHFLFDTRAEKYGGTGKKFDWSILENYKGSKKFFLSGGIGPDDAEEIKNLDLPLLAGVDINSKFEDAPGRKEVEKVRTFINTLRG